MADNKQEITLTNDPAASRGGKFTPEVRAFLDLIASREVLPGEWNKPDKAYHNNNDVKGSVGHFTDADVTAGGGFPKSAGSGPNGYNVGRYQFNRDDWGDAKKADPSIKGYSPEDQDKVALWTLEKKRPNHNALADINRGDIPAAIRDAGYEWASLPGAHAGQGKQVPKGYTVEQAVDFYNKRLEFYKAQEKGGQTTTQPSEQKPTLTQTQSNAMADGVLKQGEKGEEVRKLQEALNKNGAKLDPDGTFGPATKAAVQNYQRSHNLDPDGVVGAKTLAALSMKQEQSSAPATQAPNNATPAVKSSSGWPTPGNYTINVADKPREGDGEFGAPRSSGRGHAGIDIVGKVGDPIQSIGPGKVIQAGPAGDVAGNTVIIQHDDGTRSRYLHLDKVQVKPGDRVDADTQIATMGRSGNTPKQGDTHLHFEMYDKGGQLTDPRKFFHFEGEKSKTVEEIQKKLGEQGFKDPQGKPLVADGSYGANTAHAVREFQKANGIEATGVVDPNTLNALRNPKQTVTAPAEQQNQQQPASKPEAQPPAQPAPKPEAQQPAQQTPPAAKPEAQQPAPPATQPTQQTPTQQAPAQPAEKPANPTQPATPAQPAATTGPSAAALQAEGVLTVGAKGADVTALQQRLQDVGLLDKKGVTGTFDETTRQAVMKLEQQAGLSQQPGIYGPKSEQALGKLEQSLVTSEKFADPKAHKLYEQTLELTKTLPAGTFKDEAEQKRAAAAITMELYAAGKTDPQSMALDKKSGTMVFVFESKDPSKDQSAAARTPEPVNMTAAKEMPLSVSSGLIADLGQKQAPQAQTPQTPDVAKPAQANPVQADPQQEPQKPKVMLA